MLPAALAAMYSIGTGLYQNYKSSQLEKTPFTPYKVPDAYNQYVDNTKMAAASARMPGQSRTEDLINASVSNAIKASQESGQSSDSVLATLTGVNANANASFGELGDKAAAFQQNNNDKLNQALIGLGGEQAKEWETNKYKPYMAAMAASSALKEAGGRNIAGGIGKIARVGELSALEPAKTPAPTITTAPTSTLNYNDPLNTQSSIDPATALDPVSTPPTESITSYMEKLKNDGYDDDQINEMLGKRMAANFTTFK